jgi:hypothetical protein
VSTLSLTAPDWHAIHDDANSRGDSAVGSLPVSTFGMTSVLASDGDDDAAYLRNWLGFTGGDSCASVSQADSLAA